MEEEQSVIIECPFHGPHEWSGHIICMACGRFYQVDSPGDELFAPHDCECGARLLPQFVQEDKDESFFGKSVCPVCFEQQKPQKDLKNAKLIGEENEVRPQDRQVFAAMISGLFDNFALWPCLVNGEASCAIVSYETREDNTVKVTPHFVAATSKILITDYEGISPGEDSDNKIEH